MKKLSRSILSLLMIFALSGVSYGASEPHKIPVSTSTPIESQEANLLKHRLNEIKNMDKSDLSSREKKTLRKESKSIKKDIRGGTIYLSAGAIIVIVLLLILIL